MYDGQKLLLIVVDGQIHLTSLSTDIKLLKASFDLLTDRLTPLATDQLLIMYSILLRHLFYLLQHLCAVAYVIFNMADVNIFLLWN